MFSGISSKLWIQTLNWSSSVAMVTASLLYLSSVLKSSCGVGWCPDPISWLQTRPKPDLVSRSGIRCSFYSHYYEFEPKNSSWGWKNIQRLERLGSKITLISASNWQQVSLFCLNTNKDISKEKNKFFCPFLKWESNGESAVRQRPRERQQSAAKKWKTMMSLKQQKILLVTLIWTITNNYLHIYAATMILEKNNFKLRVLHVNTDLNK